MFRYFPLCIKIYSTFNINDLAKLVLPKGRGGVRVVIGAKLCEEHDTNNPWIELILKN